VRSSQMAISRWVVVSLMIAFCWAARGADWQQQALGGDLFPIMPWELPARNAEFADAHHGLASLAECGFNVAGFVRPQHLPECEKLGLKAIVCPADGILNWEKMPDNEIERAVVEMIDASRTSPAVIGYFITDEPGMQKFAALAKAAAVVKKHAPGKLAYINLYPDYATLGAPDLSQLGTASYSDYLERFVRDVNPQLISYDNYRVAASQDLKDPGVAASYYNNLLAIRALAMQHNLPFWNIVSSNQLRPNMPVPSPANLLFQAYTTLAAGARGLTWYTYYSGGYDYAPIDKAGNNTATWSYLKMVNDQVKVLGPRMLKLKSTGVYFTSPPPAQGLGQLPGKWVTAVKSPTPIMVGEFEQGWVMLVNLSLRDSAKPIITFDADAPHVQQVSPVDGSLAPIEKDNSIWLPAGQGALLRMR
jgi:hypothetical protein